MADLVMAGIASIDRQAAVTDAIQQGIELAHILVAEMLVQPKVTAEEVAAGDFPELDIRMLLEFADRKRDTDAEGNKVPVIVLREWARFRGEPEGPAGAGNGATAGDIAQPAVPDPDGDAV